MTETESGFYLKTTDAQKRIYGTLSQSENPIGSLVIFAHGLTGNPFEHLHMVARSEMLDHGYDVCQFWFYGFEPDARKLHECTLDIHAKDLQSVISHFKQDYENIFVAGHSYGGLTTLICNSPDLVAVSLWDPSFKPDRSQGLLAEIPEFDGYLYDGHYYGLIGKEMVREAQQISTQRWEEIAQAFKTPCQLVLADPGKTFIRNDLKDHLTMDLLKIETIQGADHCFLENSTAPVLARQTREWFDRFHGVS